MEETGDRRLGHKAPTMGVARDRRKEETGLDAVRQEVPLAERLLLSKR